ncbi:MAG TPA: hypothetical protein VKK79_13085, partial [Candidatus Lokiarchaeia archaeon]|nr:hypothetical protein [Candidatus Lokiarchaeia archaeon]
MLQSYCFDYTASILIGFYFVIIGYYFLLFAFFLVVRFRKTKKQYWLFFSLFFLLLAMSGGFFVITDFYIPAPANLPAWRIATMFAWLAVACMVEILAILLFTGEKSWVRKVKIGLPLFYVGVAVVVLLLPDAVVCQGCAGE